MNSWWPTKHSDSAIELGQAFSPLGLAATHYDNRSLRRVRVSAAGESGILKMELHESIVVCGLRTCLTVWCQDMVDGLG